jgi:hypothetical protein
MNAGGPWTWGWIGYFPIPKFVSFPYFDRNIRASNCSIFKENKN